MLGWIHLQCYYAGRKKCSRSRRLARLLAISLEINSAINQTLEFKYNSARNHNWLHFLGFDEPSLVWIRQHPHNTRMNKIPCTYPNAAGSYPKSSRKRYRLFRGWRFHTHDDQGGISSPTPWVQKSVHPRQPTPSARTSILYPVLDLVLVYQRPQTPEHARAHPGQQILRLDLSCPSRPRCFRRARLCGTVIFFSRAAYLVSQSKSQEQSKCAFIIMSRRSQISQSIWDPFLP